MMMQQPGQPMMMPPGGQMMQQPGQPQVIVVQQQQAAVTVEAETKCCFCMDVPCGLTTLMILEIFYVIYFCMMVASFLAAGALAKGIGSMPTCNYDMSGNCTSMNYSANKDASKAGDVLLYVAVGLIVAEIPRLYYMC